MYKRYYPINFDVDNKECLVVGAGAVAERKCLSLLEFRAKVTVIAPQATSGIKKLAKSNKIKWLKRKYKTGDIKKSVLAVGATPDRSVNKKISKDAKERGALVNIVDDPELCSFIVPSKIRRGPLVVSISTSGCAPAMSKALRIKLERIITPKLGQKVEKLGRSRKKRR